jgi:hypothetical protein
MFLAFTILPIAAGKLALVLASGAQEIFIWQPPYARCGPNPTNLLAAMILLAWFLVTLITIRFWNGIVVNKSLPHETIECGSFLVRFFLPFSAVCIGLNAFHPSVDAYLGQFHLFFAGSLRLVALPNILWWLLLGLWVFAMAVPTREGAYTRLLLILLVTCIVRAGGTLYHLEHLPSGAFDQQILTVRTSELLSLPGREAYLDEARYFQAVANEIRAALKK